uniref:Uncharacterized protein n=1 Tax=Rhizophora mucronata TaxID=61149 RepID=A0A2P2R1N7_RHIMU
MHHYQQNYYLNFFDFQL